MSYQYRLTGSAVGLVVIILGYLLGRYTFWVAGRFNALFDVATDIPDWIVAVHVLFLMGLGFLLMIVGTLVGLAILWKSIFQSNTVTEEQ